MPDDPESCPNDDSCNRDLPKGPPRRAGGATGANNLSPASANRTGGATSGVGSPNDKPKLKPPPDPRT